MYVTDAGNTSIAGNLGVTGNTTLNGSMTQSVSGMPKLNVDTSDILCAPEYLTCGTSPQNGTSAITVLAGGIHTVEL